MDHPEGAGSQRSDRVEFDPRVRLEFRGTQLGSDGGLLVMRELDDALGLSDLASDALHDSRRGSPQFMRASKRRTISTPYVCQQMPSCVRKSHIS